jgi:type I restriction enzyme M protein
MVTYDDVAGFCYSAAIEQVREQSHILTPGRYVGAAEAAEDGEPIAEKIDRLTKELLTHFDESCRLTKVVRHQLERIGD